MQLCICINCFLKAHNKKLNKYCLNFTFFLPKKKSFKKMVRVRVGSGWPVKNTGQVTGQLVFTSGQKNQGQVGSGQKTLTRFAMSRVYGLFFGWWFMVCVCERERERERERVIYGLLVLEYVLNFFFIYFYFFSFNLWRPLLIIILSLD